MHGWILQVMRAKAGSDRDICIVAPRPFGKTGAMSRYASLLIRPG